jgi:hypothetical protein
MLQKTIEQVIRDFDFHNYGIEGFGDLQDPNTHEWPPELAAEIVKAVSGDIEQAMLKAVEYGVAMGAAFNERGRSSDNAQ